MTDVDRLVFEDEQGNDYTLFIEAAEPLDLPDSSPGDDDDDYERMGAGADIVKVKLSEVHAKLQNYARYAIGAFQNVPFADVEEITLKFGVKISGSTGIPILTHGSVEGDFHIEIKCKPKQKEQN
ncbi:CU044_2847 family protein [Leptothoe sp. PORK10 BA2]|uniref:CU044_2847 family protein n=1 Tax=Leptothoe sp. PORK10 BA2 TaxID=3110254 RepID=UPI002B212927|nr:CU044_2847 family protein [Leptothoe sp. PORK10 BA2]MEA5467050.1 CU044_2847 family protein [Leptothoe sp. PORK10 BA2]